MDIPTYYLVDVVDDDDDIVTKIKKKVKREI